MSKVDEKNSNKGTKHKDDLYHDQTPVAKAKNGQKKVL